MLILSKKSLTSLRAESWSISIDAGLRAAGKRIRWRRTLEAVAFTMPLIVLLAAFYVVVARFTLADLPRWPLLLVLPMWLVGIVLWSARQHITRAEAARYLDRNLDLDERMSTCLEIINSARLARSRSPHNPLSYALFVDAAEALDTRLDLLPGSFRLPLRMTNALAIAGALLLLTGALMAPTTVDLIRAEKIALGKSVQDQLLEVRALRADIDKNQQISGNLKQAMLGELDGLENKLNEPGLDRAGGIAALADSEERLRSLLQRPSDDFDALVAGAQIVWNGVGSNLKWDPLEAASQTDLGRAAEATQFLAAEVSQLSATQERRLSAALERGSSQVSARDARLGTELGGGATAIRTRDRNKAVQALTQAAQGFASADRAREDSLSLETALSKLNKGREQIAQVGKPSSRKSQVGFRRRGVDTSSGPQTPATPGDGQSSAGGDQQDGNQSHSQSQKSGMGPTMGGNVPAYGSTQADPQPNSPSNGPPSANSGQGGTNAPGSSVAGGDGKNAQPGVQDGANQAGSPKTSGGSSGDSGGQAGTLQGQINGPVGGTSGAISQVKNPAGAGGSTGQGVQADTQGASDTEQVYVPGKSQTTNEAGGGSPPGQVLPQDTQGGDGGQASRSDPNGTSGEQVSGGRGSGGLAPVHTPYKQVIGKYAAQATDALERAYIPPDAKDYVRDYFSGLGK